MYNAITRAVEPELIPVLRQLNMRFYIYNPLAGGLLTGRYSTVEEMEAATEGRFSQEFDKSLNVPVGTVMYRNRFGKRELFEACALIREAIAALATPASAAAPAEGSTPVVEESVSMVNGVKCTVQVTENAPSAAAVDPNLNLISVSLRWLLHHSCLRKDDGIILGASKTQHLIGNLAAWRAGPLPPTLVAACDAAWAKARPACESYFRGFGAQPGGVEQFLKLKDEEAAVEDQNMS